MSFRPGINRVSLFDVGEQPLAKVGYRYASNGNTPAATPTDVLVITGSASKLVRLRRIYVGALATAAGSMIVNLIRRSTADTTGTKTSPTPQKIDTADAAATATVDLYTANPGGLGTAVGTLSNRALFFQLVGAGKDFVEWNWSEILGRGIALRGVLDSLAINFGGAAVPSGGKLDFELEWSEE